MHALVQSRLDGFFSALRWCRASCRSFTYSSLLAHSSCLPDSACSFLAIICLVATTARRVGRTAPPIRTFIRRRQNWTTVRLIPFDVHHNTFDNSLDGRVINYLTLLDALSIYFLGNLLSTATSSPATTYVTRTTITRAPRKTFSDNCVSL